MNHAKRVPGIPKTPDPSKKCQSSASSYAKKFTGKYAHRTIKGGIGHNLPQEAPQAFAQAIVDVAKS
jgi:pimeloyl-ACP methyl ester carboxylesterase